MTLLIPRRIYGALATPGETVRLLMRGGPPAARLLALGRLMAVDAPSRQPRDWDPVLLKRALMLPDQSYEDALASMFGYYVALDRDDILAAGDLLQRALAAAGRVSPRWRASFALEAAFFYAHHQKDATTARRWMKLEETRFKGTTLLARAETALLLAEGRPEIARMRARQALWKHQRGGLPTTADVVWLQEIVDQTGNAGDPSASP